MAKEFSENARKLREQAKREALGAEALQRKLENLGSKLKERLWGQRLMLNLLKETLKLG